MDARGKITPLYPWNMDDVETRDLKTAPPACQAVRVIVSPMTIGKGWAFEKDSGLNTVLFLARRAPGGEKLAFDELLGAAGPLTKVRDRSELAIFRMNAGSPGVQVLEAKNRGAEAEAQEADRSLVAVMDKLRAEFDLMHAVRFAQVDE
jgi:hypothetical protein